MRNVELQNSGVLHTVLLFNLRAIALLAIVVVIMRVRLPFVAVVGLVVLTCVALTIVFYSARERLERGLRKEIDDSMIYARNYELAFARSMVTTLLLVLTGLMAAGAGLYLIPENLSFSDIVEQLKWIYWPALIFNIFHLIFWVVKSYLHAR